MTAVNPAAVELATDTKRGFPGYGLPLNYEPKEKRVTLFMQDAADKQIKTWARHDFNPAYKYPQFTRERLFPTALGSKYGLRRLFPLRELTMMRLMNSITDKPNWVDKIFDSEITTKWKSEAIESAEDITEGMFNFCIAELQIRADTFKKHGYVVAYDGDVVKSDTAVSEDLTAALRHAVKVLEDVPEKHMDWHPGSGGKVLDLVHPSLFPLVYGRSRVLEKGQRVDLGKCLEFAGTGVAIQEDETTASHGSMDWPHHFHFRGAEYSLKYQWLPCDVVLEDGKPKVTSYINNLHPVHHRPLYPIIESLIDAAIPLWNATLTTSDHYTPRVPYNSVDYDLDPYTMKEGDPGYPIRQKDESNDDYRRRFWTFIGEVEGRQTLLVPEPAMPMIDLNLDDKHKINLKRDYKNFQVIVKLANIILTPETPEYEGGTWHVEGQMNEHICATALYYYDCHNITESHLSFRQLSSKELAEREEGLYYRQDRHEWLLDVFGFNNEDDSLQEIGSVVCSQGRLITFPNTLQHRVQPFKLADPTKPGHRKIVALFLVDPNLPIISTAIVPPQRHDWWAEKVLQTGVVDGLPQELKDDVLGKVEDWPMHMEEAKTTRLDLMDERKVYTADHIKGMKDAVFSLCEH